MRIVFYAWPAVLEHVFPKVLALSQHGEVHLVVETSPENKGRGALGALPDNLPEGVHRDAWPTLAGWLPTSLYDRLRASVRLHRVVHDCRRAYLPQTIAVSLRAAGFIRSLRPDVVHFDETPTRTAWTFLGLGRIPIVASVHDMESHPGEERARGGMVRRIAWRRVSHLAFYSRYCRSLYDGRSDLPRRPSTVVPLGPLDTYMAWEKGTVATDPRAVLFLGRLSPYKGLPTLIDAAPAVAERVPGARFIIAGSPFRGYVLPALPELPRGGRFEVRAQFVDNEALCELYRQAAVVVLPYNSATQSGVVMTAYAFEKPVVATAVGGLPEAVDDGITGLLVPPREPGRMADAIADLLEDDSRRERMADAIRDKLRGDFSWERHAEKLIDVYTSVVAGKAPDRATADEPLSVHRPG